MFAMRLSGLTGATCAVAAAAVIAACGSSSSSQPSAAAGGSSTAAVQPTSAAAGTTTSGSAASSGVATAAAAVTKSSAAPVFTAPGPAFKVASGLNGKTIWYVANGLNFPFSENLVTGVNKAAAVEGMKVVAVDGNGQPAKAASLIQEGISQHVAAIVIQAFPTASVDQPVKAAKAAGIPVIQINDGDPGLPSPTAKAAGVFANVASCYACGGSSLADLVVANTKGHADVAFIDVPDISTTISERNAFKARLAALCPSCKVMVASSPVAQWGTLGQLTSSLLKSDPSINYLVPALSDMFPIMKPAVYAANAQNKVQASAYNATKVNMVPLKQAVMVSGLVGNPEEWIGWAVVDEALRALSKQPPVADEKIPNRTFTHQDTQPLDLNQSPITWYGNAGFEAGYRKLWEQ
jgi:ribose transport system substrate-binding protein